MPTDLHIILTKRHLYNQLKQTLDAQSKHNLLSGTLDEKEYQYLHLMDAVPTAKGISTLQHALGVSAEFVYIDEDYPKLKEWTDLKIKTAWLNQNAEWVRDYFPIHDAEIHRVEDVTHLAELLQKPRLEQCLRWWDAWEVPENVRSHSRAVSRSAYVLAVMMKNRGLNVDPILAHRAGLLHDIDKITTLNSGVHGAVGAEFIFEQGYPGIAEIVRNHIMSTILEPGANEMCWEDKLVYCCDKLVEGDQIVPFDQRLQALKVRYPHYIDIMEQAESAIWALSDEICFILEIAGHQHLVTLLMKFNKTSAEVH